jgi:dodecin
MQEFYVEDHTYKHIEITGSSETGTDDAIRNAIAKASKTVRNMHWFEVVSTRGYIETNAVHYWQVTIKIGFRLED